MQFSLCPPLQVQPANMYWPYRRMERTLHQKAYQMYRRYVLSGMHLFFFFFISFTLLKSTQNRVIMSFVLTKNNRIWPWATRRSNYVPVQHIADKIFHFLFPMNQNSLLILVNCRFIPRIYSVVEIYSWNRTERKIRMNITKRREVIQKQRNNKIGKNSNMFIKLYVVIFVIYLIYWHSYYQCSLYLFIKW